MQSVHSFFISEPGYCKNAEGLVEYLQEKVEEGLMCITCENKKTKDFNSGEAVRQHMLDKGHCFMKTDDGYEEYLSYYDFSNQFKEILESQKNRAVPGI
jgi:pre-60S factor REI1